MTELIDRLAAHVATELATEDAALAALAGADEADPPPAAASVRARLPEKGVTVGLHRLLSRALLAAGDADAAADVVLALAERLNQAGYWTALARATAPLVHTHPREAAPLIARARTQGGADAVPDDLLEAAHAGFPRHGLLAWRAAEARLARGDTSGASTAAATALPELLEDKNYEIADEALLLLAEDSGLPALRALLAALVILARQEAWSRFDAALDLAVDASTSTRAADLTWPVVHDLWLKHPERESLRRAAGRVLRVALASYPDPESLLRVSELERASQSASVVLERLRRATMFPPGYFARHSGWGIGRIRENDTENLVVDFPTKPMHRMTFATAEKALEPLAAEDLRVLLVMDPPRIERMRRDAPAELVALALATLKHREGTVDDLRRVLVPSVFPSTAWAGWWKTARTAAAGDPRIDARRAYENVYRLSEGDEDSLEVQIPGWDVKRDLAKNLVALDTFLAHHPRERGRVLDAYRDRVTAAASDPRRSAEMRVAAGLWLLRLDPKAAVEPAAAVTADFDFNALSKAEQEELLARLSRPEGFVAALDSRLAGVRREAWSRLVELGLLDTSLRTLLPRAQERPEAALFVLEEGFDLGAPGEEDPAWTALYLHAFLDLLERPPRETHQKRALALMTKTSPFARRLLGAPVAEEGHDAFTLRLKRWQGTDRIRFPLLDYLREVSHAVIAEEVEGHRVRSAAKLGQRMAIEPDDPYEGELVVTRRTLARLEEERTRVGMELKTAIPRAIQRARELGDLKENAEYHAAKDKQATYARRFEELETLLNRVRLIESIERPAGVAMPGTEVHLVAMDENPFESELVLWLLGEGDQELAENVVSFRASVGVALLNRHVGDEIDLPRETGPRSYRIARVEERLP